MYTLLAIVAALALLAAPLEPLTFPPPPPARIDAVDPGYFMVTRMFCLAPIDASTCDHWYYSWSSPSEIHADDWIELCGHNNYLGIPRGFEGDYLSPDAPSDLTNQEEMDYRDSDVSGDALEAVMRERFGVEAAHLRASQWYHAQSHTYTLVNGGGLGAVPLRVVQDENRITVEVGLMVQLEFWADRMAEWNAISIENYVEGYMAVPVGTLELEPARDSDGFGVNYLSYRVTAAQAYLDFLASVGQISEP